MAVEARVVRVLSIDTGNEMFYHRKAVAGDIVTVYFNDKRTPLQGRIADITNSFLLLDVDVIIEKIPLIRIASFNVDFRGEACRCYFH